MKITNLLDKIKAILGLALLAVVTVIGFIIMAANIMGAMLFYPVIIILLFVIVYHHI